MKVAFLTEMGFTGTVPAIHPNMRTEFAWMHALDATHYPILKYNNVSGFDFVFIIWPKGRLDLNAEGLSLSNTHPKRLYNLLCESGEIVNIIPNLKQRNNKVFFVQEGPNWWWQDYTLSEQIYHSILLSQSDAIFCHNESDVPAYTHYQKPVHPIRTLLIEDSIKNIDTTNKENKVIVGGNFCKWYGGMTSYAVATPFRERGAVIYAPSMHNKQPGEEQLVKHLEYKPWVDWMKELSKFKAGIHMMPTVAAGTFSLNCAYLGIPVIGNVAVDAQFNCHPTLSVDVSDVSKALELATQLATDSDFYQDCSKVAYLRARSLFIKEPWLDYMTKILKSL